TPLGRRRLQVALPAIFHDPDNRVTVGSILDDLAQRTLLAEVEARHRVVDHGHRRRSRCVAVLELAAFNQRNSDRLKVGRADLIEARRRVLLAQRFKSIDADALRARIDGAEQAVLGDGRGLDARDRSETFERAIDVRQRSRGPARAWRQVSFYDEDVVARVADVECLEMPEAPDEHARRNQERYG